MKKTLTSFALLFVISFLSQACSRAGNEAILSGSFGTALVIVDGNEQTGEPNSVFPVPLTVQVRDEIIGTPIRDVVVRFTNITEGDVKGGEVLDSSDLTDDSGIASIRVRSPQKFNIPMTIRATVEGTNVSADFTIYTNSSGICSTFEAAPSTSPANPVAGEIFSLDVQCKDAQGNNSAELVGPYDITVYWSAPDSWINNGSQWLSGNPLGGSFAIIYDPSNGGAPAPLDSIPYTITCTFVAGYCNTGDLFVLTDARNNPANPTLLSVGDALGDIAAVFADPITVDKGTPTLITFANKAGGDIGLDGLWGINPGTLVNDSATHSWDTVSNPFAATYTADAAAITAYPVVIDAAGNWVEDLEDDVTVVTVSEISRFDADAPVASTLTNYIPHTPGGSPAPYPISFIPARSGKVLVTASSGSYSDASRTITINRGLPDHLRVRVAGAALDETAVDFADPTIDPELKRQKITAGQQYDTNVSARDAKENLIIQTSTIGIGDPLTYLPYTGAFTTDIDFDLQWKQLPGITYGSTPPAGQRQQWDISACPYYRFRSGPTSDIYACNNLSYSQTFLGAIPNGNPNFVIGPPTDLTDISNTLFTLTTSTAVSGIFSSLSGTSLPLRIDLGAPSTLTLFQWDPLITPKVVDGAYGDGFGVNPLFLGDENIKCNNLGGQLQCINVTAGDPSEDYFILVTDTAGNIHYDINPPDTQWTPSGAVAGSIYPLEDNGTPVPGTRPLPDRRNRGRFDPLAPGIGSLSLTATIPDHPTIPGTTLVRNNAYSYNISTGNLDHWEISVTDSRSLQNRIMATKSGSIKLEARDNVDNLVSLSGSINVDLTIETPQNGGLTNWTPCNMTGCTPGTTTVTVTNVPILNGRATITGLRLPNTADSTLVTVSLISGGKASNSVSPTIDPGAAATLRIRKTSNGIGGASQEIQGLTTNITSGNTYAYFAATYDLEGNWKTDVGAQWDPGVNSGATSSTPVNGIHLVADINNLGVVQPFCPGQSGSSSYGPLTPVGPVAQITLEPFRTTPTGETRVLRAIYDPVAADKEPSYVNQASADFKVLPAAATRLKVSWENDASGFLDQPMLAGERFNVLMEFQDNDCNTVTTLNEDRNLLFNAEGMIAMTSYYNTYYSNITSALAPTQYSAAVPVPVRFVEGKSTTYLNTIGGIAQGDIWFRFFASGSNQRIRVTDQTSSLSSTTGTAGSNYLIVYNESFDHMHVTTTNQVTVGKNTSASIIPRDRYGNIVLYTSTGLPSNTNVVLQIPTTPSASCVNMARCGGSFLGSGNLTPTTLPTISADTYTLQGQINSLLNSGVGTSTFTYRESGNASPGLDLAFAIQSPAPARPCGGAPPSCQNHRIETTRYVPLPVNDSDHTAGDPPTIAWDPTRLPGTADTPDRSYVASSTIGMSNPTGFRAKIYDRYGNFIFSENSAVATVSMPSGPGDDSLMQDIATGTFQSTAINGYFTWTGITYPRVHATPVELVATYTDGGSISVDTAIALVQVKAGPTSEVLALFSGPDNTTPWSEATQGGEQSYIGGVNSINDAIGGVINTKVAGSTFRVTVVATDLSYNRATNATAFATLSLVSAIDGTTPADTNASIVAYGGNLSGTNCGVTPCNYTAGMPIQFQAGDQGAISFLVTPKKAGSYSAWPPAPTFGSSYKVRATLTGVFLSDQYSVAARTPTNAAGSKLRLVTTLPGQSIASGQPNNSTALTTAVTGTASNWTVGTSYNPMVSLTDEYYNPVNVYPGVDGETVTLITNDRVATTDTQTLSTGQATFSMSFKRAMPYSNASIGAAIADAALAVNSTTVSTAIIPLANQHTSEIFNTRPDVATATLTKLSEQSFSPGQNSLNYASALSPTGVPSCPGNFCREAGLADPVHLIAVDQFSNVATSQSGAVTLNSPQDSIPNYAGTFSSGVAAFNPAPLLATGASPTYDNSGYTQNFVGSTALNDQASNDILVKAGSAARTLVVLPGQSYNPGQASGDIASALTGTVDVNGLSYAGNPFSFEIFLVDQFFNRVTASGTSVAVASDGLDPSAEFSFNAGSSYFPSGNFSFTSGRLDGLAKNYKSGASRTISAVAGALVAQSATTYKINNGPATQIVFANAGVIQNFPTQYAGTPFDIPVEIRDQWSNLVTIGPDATATLTLSLAANPVGGAYCDNTGPSCAAPGSLAKVAAGGATLYDDTTEGLNFKKVGSYRMTATKSTTAGAATQYIPAGTGVVAGNSNAFQTSNSPATSIVLAGVVSGVSATQLHTPIVTVFDDYGNAALDYAGTVTFSTNQNTEAEYVEIAAPTLPADTAFNGVSGNLTLSNQLRLTAATNYTGATPLTVTVEGPTGDALGTMSDTVTGIQITNDALAHFHMRWNETTSVAARTATSSSVVGEPLSVLRLRAEDQFNNRVIAYNGTTTFESSDKSTWTGDFATRVPSDYTFIPGTDEGQHDFLPVADKGFGAGTLATSVIFRRTDSGAHTGTRSVRVRDPGVLAGAWFNSPNVSIESGDPFTLALETKTGDPQSGNIVVNNFANNAQPSFKVFDVYDNPVNPTAAAQVRYDVTAGGSNASINGSSTATVNVVTTPGATLGLASVAALASGWRVAQLINGSGNPNELAGTLLSPTSFTDYDATVWSNLRSTRPQLVSDTWSDLYARSDVADTDGNGGIRFAVEPNGSETVTAGVNIGNILTVGLYDQFGNEIDDRTATVGDKNTSLLIEAYTAAGCTGGSELALPPKVPAHSGALRLDASYGSTKTVATDSITINVADGPFDTYRANFNNLNVITAATDVYFKASSPSRPELGSACTTNAITIIPAAPTQITFGVPGSAGTLPQSSSLAGDSLANFNLYARDVFGNEAFGANYSPPGAASIKIEAFDTAGCGAGDAIPLTPSGDPTLTDGDFVTTWPTKTASGGLGGTLVASNFKINATGNVYLKASADAGNWPALTSECLTSPINVTTEPYRIVFSRMPVNLAHADAPLTTAPRTHLLDRFDNLADGTALTARLTAFTDASCTTALPATAPDGATTSMVSGDGADYMDIGSDSIASFSTTRVVRRADNIYFKASVDEVGGILTDCTGSAYNATDYPVSNTTLKVTSGNPVVVAGTRSTLGSTTNIVVYEDGTNAGRRAQITVTLKDQFDNFVTTGVAPLSLSAPTISITGTNNYDSGATGTSSSISCGNTNSIGVATCEYASRTAETKTLGITAPAGLGSLSTTTRFLADVADALAFTQGNFDSSVSAGNNFTAQPVVKINDQYGNTVEVDGSPSPDANRAATINLVAYSDNTCITPTGNAIFTSGVSGASLAASSATAIATFANINYRVAENIYLKADSAGVPNDSACLGSNGSTTPITVNGLAPNKDNSIIAITNNIDVAGPNPVHLARNSAPGSTNVQITLKDLFNNPVPNETPDYVVTAGTSVSKAACSLSDSSGISTCKVWDDVAGLRTLQIDEGTSSFTWHSGTTTPSTNLRIAPAAANKLFLSTEALPTTGTIAGAAFATQPVVQIRDSYDNNILSSATATSYGLTPDAKLSENVTLAAKLVSCSGSSADSDIVVDGSGNENGKTSIVAASNGVANFSSQNITMTTTDESAYLCASAPGLTGIQSTNPYVVDPSPATYLSIASGPATNADFNAGSTLTTVNVEAYDRYANLADSGVNSFTDSVAIAILNDASALTDASLGGTLSKAASAGTAAFNDLDINKTGDGYTLQVSSGVLATDDSNAFDIIPANLGSFEFAVTPPIGNKAGDTWAIEVTAKDTLGNVKTDYTGTVAFSTTDPHGNINKGDELPNDYPFVGGDAGVKSFNIKLLTMGSWTVTATDAVAVVDDTTTSITVDHTDPEAISIVAGDGQSAENGTNVSIAPDIRVVDAYGNNVDAETISWSTNETGASVNQTGGTSTAVDGTANVTSWTLGTDILETQELRATCAACGTTTFVDFSATATAGSPASIEIVSGDNQSGIVAGQVVGAAIVADVKDSNGNLVAAGETVTYSVTAGGGSISSGATRNTNASGRVTLAAADWTTGTVVGANTVSASIDGGDCSPAQECVDFDAATIPGALTDFTFSVTPPVGNKAGDTWAVEVTARDINNNVKTNYTGTVAFSTSDPHGDINKGDELPNDYPFIVGDAGVKSFNVKLLTMGSQTITVTDGGVNDTTSSLTVDHTDADVISIVAGDGQSAENGSNVSIAPDIRVVDAYGNNVDAETISWSTDETGASVNQTGGLSTAVDGTANVTSWTLGTDILETQELRATCAACGTTSFVDFSATATAGALTDFTFSVTPPVGNKAGDTWAVEVTARDSNNNVKTDYTGTVAFSTSDPHGNINKGDELPNDYPFIGGDAGVKSFNVKLLTMGSQTITVTDGGVSDTTASQTVDHTDAEVISIVAGDGQSAENGTNVSIAPDIRVVDAYGNNVDAETISWSTDETGASVNQTGGTSTAVDGTANVTSWTLGTVTSETHELKATCAGCGTTSFVDFSATALPGAPDPATSTFVAADDTATADGVDTVSLTVTILDSNSNPVPGVTPTIASTGTGNTSLGCNASNASGVSTCTYVSTKAEAKTVTLTAPAELTGEAGVGVTFEPGAMSILSVVDVDSGTINSGSNVTVTVQAVDADGNNITIGGEDVSIFHSGGTSDFTQASPIDNNATDNGDGTYTAIFTGDTSGSPTTIIAKIGATWAGGTQVTDTASVTVNPGAVDLGTSVLSFTESSGTIDDGSVLSGDTVTFTLTTKDAAGNLTGDTNETIHIGNLASGTSDFTAVSGLATDNNNGTYSLTMTADTSGTSTNVAAKLTNWAGSQFTDVQAITVSPGLISLANSTMSFTESSGTNDDGTVISGDTVDISLQAIDAAGNTITAGGETIFFGNLASGASDFTVANAQATDNGNGTYSLTFTADTSGTATTIGAKLTNWSGSQFTDTESITVIPGAVSLGTSVMAFTESSGTNDDGTVISGDTVTFTLTTKDAAGNLTGDTNETIHIGNLASGTSDFTAVSGLATDNNDGTYSLTMTADSSGSSTNVAAKLTNWAGSQFTDVQAITVIPGAVDLGSSVLSFTESSGTNDDGTVLSGDTVTFTLTTKDAAGNLTGDTNETIHIGNLASGTSDFTAVSGAATDNNDGTYSFTMTADTIGTATNVAAKLTSWAGSQFTDVQAITVIPGAVDLGTSVLSFTESSGTNDDGTVISGDTVTFTLTTKDAAGNLTGDTDETIHIGNLASGTSDFTAVSGLATDNNDGTYSFTMTGDTAGTSTNVAAKLTNWAGSQFTDVQAITVIPGAVDLGTSVLSFTESSGTNDDGTVISGDTVTFTLTTKDAAGNLTGDTNETIHIGNLASGTSDFTAVSGAATDNNDGTYSFTMTADTIGTATNAAAKLTSWAGSQFTDVQAITVIPGAVDLGTSVLSFTESSGTNDDGTVISGDTVTFTLTTKDAAGNLTGDTNETIHIGNLASGTSDFTAASGLATDNNDGTYSFTMTADSSGTATNVAAKLTNWAGSQFTDTESITVIPGPVNLMLSDFDFTESSGTNDDGTVISGDTVTFTLTTRDASGNLTGDTNETIHIGNLASGTSDFTAVSGLATDNNDGTYSFTMTGDSSGTSTNVAAKLTNWAGSQFTDVQAIIVIPGAVALGTSVLSFTESSGTNDDGTVLSGDTVTFKLTTKDAAGNLTGDTNETIHIGNLASGTSDFTAVSGLATDNNDGTYSFTMTADTSGTSTNVAAKLTNWAGSQFTDVQAITVAPGLISIANSTMSFTESSGINDDGTVISGDTVDISLQAVDAAGNTITTGGESIYIGNLASGASDFTASNALATDNGNGSYSLTMTADTSGTATTIGAKLTNWAGSQFTDTESITVIPGAVDLGTSVLSFTESSGTNDDGTVISGDTVTFTLTTKDAAGNLTGDTNETIHIGNLASGTSDFTAVSGLATDNNDGTYSFTMTGDSSGTSTNVAAKLTNWAGSQFTDVQAITVIPGAVDLGTSVLSFTESSGTNDDGTVLSGDTVTFTLTTKDAAGNLTGDTNETIHIGNLASGTSDFTAVSGLATDNNNGTYSFTMTADTIGTATNVAAKLTSWAGSQFTDVQAITVIPGAVDLGTSVLSFTESSGTNDDGTVISGDTVTFTLTTKDAAGNLTGDTNETIHIGNLASGTSDFTAVSGLATDNNDGTYSFTMTADTIGTATNVAAKLTNWAGSQFTDVQAITVIPGAVDLGTSVLSFTESSGTNDDGTVISGDTVTFILTTKDAAGNLTGDTNETIHIGNLASGTSDFTAVSGLATDNNDGTYSFTMTADTIGTATNVAAKLTNWAGSQFTDVQAITVIPGAVDLGTSVLSFTESSGTNDDGTVISGDTVTFTLTTKDAAGNLTGDTNETIHIGNLASGTSDFTAVSGAATDNNDGTYSFTMTADTMGTATNVAAKMTSWAGSQFTDVQAITVIPGAVDLGTSVLSFTESSGTNDDGTVISGDTVTFTLTTKDAAGNLTGDTNETIHIGNLASGTSDFTAVSGLATDNNDGTYSFTMTADTSGTSTNVAAKLTNWAGSQFTDVQAITVIPGAVDLGTSVLSFTESSGTSDDGTVVSGDTVTFTLTTKDAAGNLTGDSNETIHIGNLASGTSDFTAVSGLATDNNDGTYSFTMTADTIGTATNVAAKFTSWAGSQFTDVQAITVIPGAVDLGTSVLSFTESSGTNDDGTVISGDTVTFTLTTKDAAGNLTGDTNETIHIGNLASGTSDFTAASGAATDNNDGTYSFTMTADSSGTSTNVAAKLTSWAGSQFTDVQAITVIPGSVNLGTSVLSFTESSGTNDDGTVISGDTVTFILTTKDAAGNLTGDTNESIHIGNLASGTSDFTALSGLATDNNDGSYSFTMTADTSGTSTNVAAKLTNWAGSQFTDVQAITVIPGAVDLGTSTMAFTESSGTSDDGTVISGDNVTFTLTTKDAAGNLTGDTNETIHIGNLASGASDFTVVSALATDNNDGTYSLTMSADTSGTATTVGAKLTNWAGSQFTDTESITVIPGPMSILSTVSVNNATINSGNTTTVTVQAVDASGNNITAGGETVAIFHSGGGSTFVEAASDPATDVGDGTYTATFTGDTSGSATTIQAKIGTWAGGTLITDTASVTVDPGAFNATNSIMSVSAASIASGATVTVTIQAVDAAGNNITTGGESLEAFYAGGSSTFTTGAAISMTNVGDGTYTAVFTGDTAGTATNFTAFDGTWGSGTLIGDNENVTVIPGTADTTNSSIALVQEAVDSDSPNGTTTAQVQVTLQDAAGNAISGETVNISSAQSIAGISCSGTTNGSGQITCDFTSSTPETKTIAIDTPAGLSANTVDVEIYTTLGANITSATNIDGGTEVITPTGGKSSGGNYTFALQTDISGAGINNTNSTTTTYTAGNTCAQVAGSGTDVVRITDSLGQTLDVNLTVEFSKLVTNTGTPAYGTQSIDVDRNFVFENSGCITSGPITTTFSTDDDGGASGNTPAFELTGSDTCNGGTLSGGATCQVPVRFRAGDAALDAGSFTGSVGIDDSTDTPSFSLSGDK